MTNQHMDEVASMLDEQNRYDLCEDSFCAYDFIERDATTDVLFDSTVDKTFNEDGVMEIDEESF